MQIEKGYFCSFAQIQVVLPKDQYYKDETNSWKVIGFPGVDGIEFRQKLETQDQTIFAYYPIEGLHIEKANSIEDLILKWKANKIVL